MKREAPVVIARGGFSGLFPESTRYANDVVKQSNSRAASSCTLQMTKDGIGICLSDIRLDNSTNIRTIFPNHSNTYVVNGNQLNVVQSVSTRTNVFDSRLPVSTVKDAVGVEPSVFWLNVQAKGLMDIDFISSPELGKALIITHNGASGMYPGSTDLAYEQAVNDGADIIDCSVQMSKNGVAFCLDSADLMGHTTASAMPTFVSWSSLVPEVQKDMGIFSFDLTCSEIRTLKPQMESSFEQASGFQRNPEAKNKGKFMTLVEFLDLAKANANAAYLASKKGLDLVCSITKALRNATFDEQRTQQVLIQLDDSLVLSMFRGVPAYERLLHITKPIGDVPESTINEIKKLADGVVVISVYVSILRNEFVALPYDSFADPTRELATYVAALEVDGVITEFPGTASRYDVKCGGKRCYAGSPCVDRKIEIAAEPGALLKQAASGASALSPPANPANAPLEVADVVNPPLPAVSNVSSSTASSSVPATSSSGMAIANFGLCLAVTDFLSFFVRVIT
ncbi:Glycerophosphodiester phosphodiesterase GDPDL6 [Hibiscus syriacus]|uniref:glycerophosphodiester phosphodiesterase n=1 Tax=Hibiscus syriacus TaxID=106335 RepID=A0A6A2X1H6_HIBSY|nr:Glycerophosphodiester phosphodiesterase GDPDL6 [Hibiscus syriacus]